jgi:hypothetical protein
VDDTLIGVFVALINLVIHVAAMLPPYVFENELRLDDKNEMRAVAPTESFCFDSLNTSIAEFSVLNL